MENANDEPCSFFAQPLRLLRVESLMWLALYSYLFHLFEGSWLLFVILFFVPDISLVGYYFGAIRGAQLYNLFHSEILPICLLVGALILGSSLGIEVSFIWLAHINFDRWLGIGLKRASGFNHTHLGEFPFGKRAP